MAFSMAFNWTFSNYGFCRLLGISVTPFFIFTNFSSAQPVANNLLWMQTGNCWQLQGVRVLHQKTIQTLFGHRTHPNSATGLTKAFLPVWQSLVLSSNVYSGSEKQTLTWKNEVFPCLHTREMSHYCFSRQGETWFCFSLPGETIVAHFSSV